MRFFIFKFPVVVRNALRMGCADLYQHGEDQIAWPFIRDLARITGMLARAYPDTIKNHSHCGEVSYPPTDGLTPTLFRPVRSGMIGFADG
jgi:hypothetical protein